MPRRCRTLRALALGPALLTVTLAIGCRSSSPAAGAGSGSAAADAIAATDAASPAVDATPTPVDAAPEVGVDATTRPCPPVAICNQACPRGRSNRREVVDGCETMTCCAPDGP